MGKIWNARFLLSKDTSIRHSTVCKDGRRSLTPKSTYTIGQQEAHIRASVVHHCVKMPHGLVVVVLTYNFSKTYNLFLKMDYWAFVELPDTLCRTRESTEHSWICCEVLEPTAARRGKKWAWWRVLHLQSVNSDLTWSRNACGRLTCTVRWFLRSSPKHQIQWQ